MFADMYDDLDAADLMAAVLLAPESERGSLVAELYLRLADSSEVDA